MMVAFRLVSPPPPLLPEAAELSLLPDEADSEDPAEEAVDESADEAAEDDEDDDEDEELDVDDEVVDELEPQAARARPPTRVTAISEMDLFTSTSMLCRPGDVDPAERG